MTIVNLHLTRSRATILSDTLAVDAACRVVGHCTKVFPLPHLRAATTFRGPAWVLNNWVTWINSNISEFDVLRAVADQLARGLYRNFAERYPAAISELDEAHRCFEAVTVGWSTRQRRVVGFLNDPAANYATEDLADGVTAVPWIPGYPTRERVPLEKVVQQQLSLAAENGVPAPVGGSWFKTVVGRSGVSSRVVPDPSKAVRGRISASAGTTALKTGVAL